MENKNKYIPFIFFVPLLVRLIFNPPPLNMMVVGIFVILFLLFALFFFLEKSMKKRVVQFERIKNKQIAYSLKFSLLYGLPLSLLLTWFLSYEAKILYTIVFVVLPMVVMFGWVGFMDWKECQKKYFESKYSSGQSNAA